MAQYLSEQLLKKIIKRERIEGATIAELENLVRSEEAINNYLPDGIYQIDPRNGDRVLFNTARARRPHDNRNEKSALDPVTEKPCVICQGRTTGVVDVAKLSQGFTFINKNMFPMLHPGETPAGSGMASSSNGASPKGRTARGLHFLQWTSSQHDRDWNNMPLDDLAVVFKRLALLEETLLQESEYHESSRGADQLKGPFVGIIKNYGAPVGGSLVHGHQQIALSNAAPRTTADNFNFLKREGRCFSDYMLDQNPVSLTLRDYGEALLLVPYFMKRPYAMLVLLKDTEKSWLHQLSTSQLRALGHAWHDATNLIHKIMPEIGRETAFNVITHNGPGAGLYFEFIPFTQETGGYELLGLYVCQGNPEAAVRDLQKLLEQDDSDSVD